MDDNFIAPRAARIVPFVRRSNESMTPESSKTWDATNRNVAAAVLWRSNSFRCDETRRTTTKQGFGSSIPILESPLRHRGTGGASAKRACQDIGRATTEEVSSPDHDPLFFLDPPVLQMFHQANISGRLWKYESKARDAVIKKYGKNTDEFMDSKIYGTALLGKRLLTQGLYDKQLLHPTDFIDHALQGSSFSKPPWDSTNRNITAQRLLRNPGWKS